ncbi:MAG TPA: hypothetical protein VK912_05535 [Longimicrobiales bacterium]|nr:hypothetical protein [Longimicrobiales bacterium]
MIERLITSLDALAAPADVQLRHIAGDASGRAGTADVSQASAGPAAAARDLAFEFADALLLVSDCPQVLLSAAQRQALDALDEQLEGMLREGGAQLWQPMGLRESVEWKTARRLAAGARRMLGTRADW